MQANQSYDVVINNLFTHQCGLICGASVEVAIMDGGIEIDRLTFKGKVGPGGTGYRKVYQGKPGLTAELVVGSCDMTFAEGKAERAPLL
ncbi:hypothetical protein AUC61_14645 [Pseudomonas sp. S25]|uniref:Uncharacterized protein n=1 Tax=Pseudomonas maioricensis TaxID=1766623 RepID=A0ABS9ZJL3_9PSED|nr:hypothetical protein [Pseudomonas sp. S25]